MKLEFQNAHQKRALVKICWSKVVTLMAASKNNPIVRKVSPRRLQTWGWSRCQCWRCTLWTWRSTRHHQCDPRPWFDNISRVGPKLSLLSEDKCIFYDISSDLSIIKRLMTRFAGLQILPFVAVKFYCCCNIFITVVVLLRKYWLLSKLKFK